MGKDLKAENLTISLPNRGCNKNCPYCVSRMTGYMESDFWLMLKNAKKVRRIAEAAEVTSVLFTGKGEPLLSFDELRELSSEFRDFPLELQTNGLLLDESALNALCVMGMNVVAISVDSADGFASCASKIKGIVSRGMIPRITLNLAGGILTWSACDVIHNFIDLGVRQATFRRIVSPEDPKHEATAKWIEKNAPLEAYIKFMTTLTEVLGRSGKLVRTLNNGMQVWDVGGLSVMHSEYCVQERDRGDDIRSLVFQEDGHLYTSWNSGASVLF